MQATTESKCVCRADQHVPRLCAKRAEEETQTTPEEALEREWERHTEKYREEYAKYNDELSGQNSYIGECLMEKWARKHHRHLCCRHRHANWNYLYL